MKELQWLLGIVKAEQPVLMVGHTVNTNVVLLFSLQFIILNVHCESVRCNTQHPQTFHCHALDGS